MTNWRIVTKYYPEIAGSLLCLTLGMLSGYSVNASDFSWYASLTKPGFTPPAWVFGPVWTLLYIMMGVAFGILWKDKINNKPLIFIFAAQLLVNLLWSPIFFYHHSIILALLDICLLWAMLLVFMFKVRKQKPILLLFFPYFLWVSLALTLNLNIYLMNGI